MTVVNAVDAFYNYRRRWVQNNDTVMKLYALASDIKYAKAKVDREGILTSESMDIFYDRYKNILQDANEGWKEDRLAATQKN
jgi:predicted nucleic acid-binding protein